MFHKSFDQRFDRNIYFEKALDKIRTVYIVKRYSKGDRKLVFVSTNAKLLGKERHDDFHVSGYGTSIKAGLNVTFFKHFYIFH